MLNQIYLKFFLNKFTGKMYHQTATKRMKLKVITWEILQFLSNLCVELNQSLSNILAACSRLLDPATSTLDKNATPNTHKKLIESVDLFEDDLMCSKPLSKKYFHWKTFGKTKRKIFNYRFNIKSLPQSNVANHFLWMQ